VLIYPETLTAKVYRLIEHQYRKQADYNRERHLFELSKCRIDFDFGFAPKGYKFRLSRHTAQLSFIWKK